MNSRGAENRFGKVLGLHSVGWLAAANVVGLWMAVCLVWPEAGRLWVPLTFGRWVPLHLNWQLYGWCSLPLVGALLVWFAGPALRESDRGAGRALGAWSVALALGGIAWLGGNVSGKLFLDWQGWTRPLLPLAMLGLWIVLTHHTWRRWKDLDLRARASRVLLLMLLSVIPPVLYGSTGRGVYPAVNPDSGGATGAALLGSTLGIVTIFMLIPRLLGKPETRSTRSFAWFLGLSWIVFVGVDRGHTSHHALSQIIPLGLLLIWVPLLPAYWWRHTWTPGALPWLRAGSLWWGLLLVSGWLTFLPGLSEMSKFTHALVGHAHLAMAGLITSVNAAVLHELGTSRAPRGSFWCWQAGCAVFVLSMLLLGYAEFGHEGELYRAESWTQGLMAARLVGGLAMTTGSLSWWVSLLRT